MSDNDAAKRSRWVWEGFFSMEISDDWEVHEPGDVIEVVPPHDVDGALHISVVIPTSGAFVEKGKASELAASFAERQGDDVKPPPERIVDGHPVAALTFTTSQDGRDRMWDVHVRAWESHALVCTYNHAGVDNEVRANARDARDDQARLTSHDAKRQSDGKKGTKSVKGSHGDPFD